MSRVSQARNLGNYVLLIDNRRVVLGFFVVFPLISIRFVDQMGWAAVMVGACRRRGTWVNISCSSIICWSCWGSLLSSR